MDSPWPTRGAHHPAAARRAPKLSAARLVPLRRRPGPAVAHGAGGGGVPEHPAHRALGHDRGRAHDLHGREPPREGAERPPGIGLPGLELRTPRRAAASRDSPGSRGRARDAGAGGVRRLLRPGVPLRIAADPGRVLPHRRPRPHRRRRVRQDHRPGEGPHHPGRGEPLPGPPSRTPSPPAPGCGRWRWWAIRTSGSANGFARWWRRRAARPPTSRRSPGSFATGDSRNTSGRSSSAPSVSSPAPRPALPGKIRKLELRDRIVAADRAGAGAGSAAQ